MFLWDVRFFFLLWLIFIFRGFFFFFPLSNSPSFSSRALLEVYSRPGSFLLGSDKLGIFSETKQKTLEEIAASFGDKVVALSSGRDGGLDVDVDVDVDMGIESGNVKPESQHVELGAPGQKLA